MELMKRMVVATEIRMQAILMVSVRQCLCMCDPNQNHGGNMRGGVTLTMAFSVPELTEIQAVPLDCWFGATRCRQAPRYCIQPPFNYQHILYYSYSLAVISYRRDLLRGQLVSCGLRLPRKTHRLQDVNHLFSPSPPQLRHFWRRALGGFRKNRSSCSVTVILGFRV